MQWSFQYVMMCVRGRELKGETLLNVVCAWLWVLAQPSMSTAVSVPGCVVLVARGEKELLQVCRLTPSCLSFYVCLFWFTATSSCMTKNMADNKGSVPVLSSQVMCIKTTIFTNPFNVTFSFTLHCFVHGFWWWMHVKQHVYVAICLICLAST